MINKRITVLTAIFCLVAILASSQSSSSNDFEGETHHEVSALVTINGADDVTVDFGFCHPNCSIGDFVWKDLDKDGIQDEGEEGIFGLNLSLYHTNNDTIGELINSTTSNETGHYVFDGLGYGSYIVVAESEFPLKFPEDKKDWGPTYIEKGDQVNDSNNHDRASVVLDKFNFINLSIDFGYRPYS